MSKLAWTVSGITDVGLQRNDNQDNYYISPDSRVFVVADGMGGAANGALASKVAVETLQELWSQSAPDYDQIEATKAWLVQAVGKANCAVMDIESAGYHRSYRPGTTIVVAVQAANGRLLIAHVGDSRAYLCRGDKAESITRDHSFVMEMMMNNQLDAEQAWTNPYRNLLTRCLGHDANVEVELSEAELQAGDWVLLCSDGLSGVLKDVEIAGIVGQCNQTQELCDKLVDAVKENNAPDNVTIVALRLVAAFTPEAAAANGVMPLIT